jgi:hypothetical protein
MGKPVHYLLLALVLLGCFSCKRHVCPAYYSAFNIEQGAPEAFFNYFLVDTAASVVAISDSVPNNHRLLRFESGKEPANDRMFASKGKDINGLMRRKGQFWASIFPKKRENTMRVVRAKVTFSEVDSATAFLMQAEQDSIPFKQDQFMYMKLIGYEILDSIKAQEEREQARLDTLDESSLPRKEQRRLRKERKKEYRRLKKAARRGEIDPSVPEEYYAQYLDKNRHEREEADTTASSKRWEPSPDGTWEGSWQETDEAAAAGETEASGEQEGKKGRKGGKGDRPPKEKKAKKEKKPKEPKEKKPEEPKEKKPKKPKKPKEPDDDGGGP